jgi:hypothetical protein
MGAEGGRCRGLSAIDVKVWLPGLEKHETWGTRCKMSAEIFALPQDDSGILVCDPSENSRSLHSASHPLRIRSSGRDDNS